MKILITNDDGIHALGISALYTALSSLGDILVVAPERPRSACSHAITLHKPLRLRAVKMPDGKTGYASNGTPADCVALGVSEYLGGPPDIVVSGINAGPNLGIDMTYSGTVAAAKEAAICGLPSFAISIASYDWQDFVPAAEFARYLTQKIAVNGMGDISFINVNVPALSASEIAGISITRQGRLRYNNRIERRTDPRGGEYYWLTGERVDRSEQPDGDCWAITNKKISVTPVRLEVTDDKFVEVLQAWNLHWPIRDVAED